jgi:DNA-binding transcriptional MerR regulator
MEGAVHIGEAGKLAGMSVDTIRFYQRQGLIPATPRSAGGYRLFSEDQIRDLTFVRHAQELGFSLAEIKELLSFRQSQHVCPGVQSLLERKLNDVRNKVERLVHMEEDLGRELRNCKRELRTRGNAGHEECCPLIEKLEQMNGTHGKRAKRSGPTRN